MLKKTEQEPLIHILSKDQNKEWYQLVSDT